MATARNVHTTHPAHQNQKQNNNHSTHPTHPTHLTHKPSSGSGVMAKTQVANETSSTDDLNKKVKKIINFGDTPFEVSTKTIRGIADSIRERHESKGEGSPARDLALIFCGDEKFAPVISFVVSKYLADEIETTPGLGFTVKGLPKPVAPPIEVTPATLKNVERLLAEALKGTSPKSRGISEDQVVMIAAARGMLTFTDGGMPDDREVRAAVHLLCSGPEAPFEQARGSGIRRRVHHEAS